MSPRPSDPTPEMPRCLLCSFVVASVSDHEQERARKDGGGRMVPLHRRRAGATARAGARRRARAQHDAAGPARRHGADAGTTVRRGGRRCFCRSTVPLRLRLQYSSRRRGLSERRLRHSRYRARADRQGHDARAPCPDLLRRTPQGCGAKKRRARDREAGRDRRQCLDRWRRDPSGRHPHRRWCDRRRRRRGDE